MFGGQVVFKVRKGKRFVAAPPDVNPNRKPTPNQKIAQERFKFVSEYANEAIKDAATKFMYQQVAGKRQSAQNMVFKDAYNAPEVRTVTAQGYKGLPGNIIVIHAVDDFRVTGVLILIVDKDNNLIERGDAVLDKGGVLWIYNAIVRNNIVAGCKVQIIATDVPENRTTAEVIFIERIFCFRFY